MLVFLLGAFVGINGRIGAELELSLSQFSAQAQQAATIAQRLGQQLQAIPVARPTVDLSALQASLTQLASQTPPTIPVKVDTAAASAQLQQFSTAASQLVAQASPTVTPKLDSTQFVAGAKDATSWADQMNAKIEALRRADAEDVLRKDAQGATDLGQAAKSAADGVEQANTSIKRVSTGQFLGEMGAARSSINNLVGSLGVTGPAASALTNNLTGLASAGGLISPPLVAGVGALAAFAAGAVAATKAAVEFEKELASVKSIKLDLDTTKLQQQITDLAQKTGVSTKELAAAEYNIFSSIDIGADDSIKLLELFSKGSVAAQTDAKAFGTAILGVMNAYGKSVDDAEKISDLFFNTVRDGVDNGRELAAALGPVVASAKALNIPLEEMFALMVGVTKQGGDAAQNFNNLNNVFTHLLTKEATQNFADLGVQVVNTDGSMRDVLAILNDLNAQLSKLSPAARAASLQQLAPDLQARQGLQTVLDQLPAINKALQANREEAGSTATAYEVMAGTTAAAADRMEQRFQALQVSIGNNLKPGFDIALDLAGKLGDRFNDLGTAMDAAAATGATAMIKLVQAARGAEAAIAAAIQAAQGRQPGADGEAPPPTPAQQARDAAAAARQGRNSGRLGARPDLGTQSAEDANFLDQQAEAQAQAEADTADTRQKQTEFADRYLEVIKQLNEYVDRNTAADEQNAQAMQDQAAATGALLTLQERLRAGLAGAVGAQVDLTDAVKKAIQASNEDGENLQARIVNILKAKEAQDLLNGAYSLHNKEIAAYIAAEADAATKATSEADAKVHQGNALRAYLAEKAAEATLEERTNVVLSAAKPLLDGQTAAQVQAAVAAHNYAGALALLQNALPGIASPELLQAINQQGVSLEDLGKKATGAVTASKAPTEELKARYTEIAQSVLPNLSEAQAVYVKQLLDSNTAESAAQAAIAATGLTRGEVNTLVQGSTHDLGLYTKALQEVATLGADQARARLGELANAVLPSLSQQQNLALQVAVKFNNVLGALGIISQATGVPIDELREKLAGSGKDLAEFTQGLANVATQGADQARARLDALAKDVLPNLTEQQGFALERAVKLGETQTALGIISAATGKSVEDLNAIIHSSGDEFQRQSGYVAAASKSLGSYISDEFKSRAESAFSSLTSQVDQFTSAEVKAKLAAGDIDGAIAVFAQHSGTNIATVREAILGMGADAKQAADAIKSAVTFQQEGRLLPAPTRDTADANQIHADEVQKAQTTAQDAFAKLAEQQTALDTARNNQTDDFLRKQLEVSTTLAAANKKADDARMESADQLGRQMASINNTLNNSLSAAETKRSDAIAQYTKVVGDAHDKLVQTTADLTAKYNEQTGDLAERQRKNVETAAEAGKSALATLSQAQQSYNQGLVQRAFDASVQLQKTQQALYGSEPGFDPNSDQRATQNQILTEFYQQQGQAALQGASLQTGFQQAQANYIKQQADAQKALVEATKENTKAQNKAAEEYAKAIRNLIEQYGRTTRDAEITQSKAIRDANTTADKARRQADLASDNAAAENRKRNDAIERERQKAQAEAEKKLQDLARENDRKEDEFNRRQQKLDREDDQIRRNLSTALDRADRKLADALNLLQLGLDGLDAIKTKIPTATENAEAIKAALQLGPQQITNNIENINETQVDFLAAQNAEILRRVKAGR